MHHWVHFYLSNFLLDYPFWKTNLLFLDKIEKFFYLKSMKKNKIIPIVIASLNFAICLSLLIFLIPNKVPLISGLRDEVVVMGSKWWLISGVILPIVFMILSLLTKDNLKRLIFTELIIFVCYNNMLGYSYFCTEKTLALGAISQIPASLSIFLPIALATFVYGASIKNIPFKSNLGIKSKRTTTTDFIWKQSHISASYYFRLSGFILFIVSIVFIFIHYPLIELAIFIIGLLVPRVIIEVGANKMSKKYHDMKKKHDHLQTKKDKTA